jgi:hypothetical protein
MSTFDFRFWMLHLRNWSSSANAGVKDHAGKTVRTSALLGSMKGCSARSVLDEVVRVIARSIRPDHEHLRGGQQCPISVALYDCSELSRPVREPKRRAVILVK